MLSLLLSVFAITVPVTHADEVEEKAVLIQTTNKPEKLGIGQRPRDFEIIEDTDEVVGDPVAGVQESRKSWKEACNEWKKELKEANPGQVVTANCGTPKMDKNDDVAGKGSGIYTWKSTAKYRLKVRVRDQTK